LGRVKKGVVVDHFAGADSGTLGISAIADVYDQHDLFDVLEDEDVLGLSRLGGAAGFPGLPSIRKSTGIRTRRILREGVSVADLAIRLCERLERDSHVDLRDCHSILLCHSHTDGNACHELARAIELVLGLPDGLITPSNYGCTGFLKLLQDASIDSENIPHGARIAVLSIETPEFWHDASDRLFCGLVSAGAIGAILEHGGRLPLDQVAADDFYIPPDRRPNPNPLFRKDDSDVFTFRGQACRRTVMRMNAESVFINAIELMLSNLRAALDSFDLQKGERVVVVPHQPSAKLLKALVATGHSEFPDVEFLNNLSGYGNVISASVPTVLSRLDEVLEQNGRSPLADGDHLVLLAAGICMEDISDKMSAGFAHIRWAPVGSVLRQEVAVVPPV
jgi:3-oxoacyl-[acyl-carrier-protein] synthase III